MKIEIDKELQHETELVIVATMLTMIKEDRIDDFLILVDKLKELYRK